MAETKLLRINNKEIVVQSVALDPDECFPDVDHVDQNGVIKSEQTGPNQVFCSFENEQAALYYENKKGLTLEFDENDQTIKITEACAYSRKGRVVSFRGYKED